MNLFFDALITLVSVAALAQYSWSMRGHFSSEGMPRGAQLLTIVVLACAILLFWLLWSGEQPLLIQLIGLVLQGLSLWLFWAAIGASRSQQLRLAFDPGNPRTFVTAGPYRWVRHPFYVSYIIFWGGWALACWSWLALIPFLVMFAVYLGAARDEERKFGLTDMAEDYRAYRSRTGMFLPRFR